MKLHRLLLLGLLALLGFSLSILAAHHTPAVATRPSVGSFANTAMNTVRVEAQWGTALPPQSTSQQSEQLGYAAYDRGQFEDAIEAWQQALRQYEHGENTLAQVQTWSNLSLAWQQLGQWDEAQAAIATSLKLLDHAEINSSLSGVNVLGHIFNTQGRLLFTLGHTHQAFDAWEQSANWYNEAKNDMGRIQSRINQTQAMQELGLYQQALAQLTTIHLTLQQDYPDSDVLITVRHRQGDLFRLIGHFSEAEQALQEALAIAQHQDADEVAAILFSLGKTASAQANDPIALDFYDRALTHISNPTATSQSVAEIQSAQFLDPMLAVQIQLAQFKQLTTNQEWQLAWQLWPWIQATLDQLPHHHDSLYAQINLVYQWLQLAKSYPVTPTPPAASGFSALGFVSSTQPTPDSSNDPAFRIHVTDQDWTHMAQRLMVTAQVARELGDRRSEIYALGYLGALYESTQQWSSAETLTQQALRMAQGADAADIAYRWQWQLGRILKAEGKEEGAIAAYTEAVNVLKTLRGELLTTSAEEQFRFRDSVEPVYRELVSLLLSPKASSPIQQINLVKARGVIEALQVAELDDFFREPCLENLSFQVDQVDSHAAVLYPIILRDRLEIILSLANQPLRHYTVLVSDQELAKVVNDFRDNLVIRSRFNFHPQSQQLYDWLVRPVIADLDPEQVNTLVFVLDGPLRNIPMAALSDGNHYLIETYRIAIAPGLNVIDPKPLHRENLSVLAAGLTEARQGFSPLTFVEPELEKIQSSIPSTVLLNEQFTHNTLQSELAHSVFPIVHIATHGQFSSTPENTFLLTWSDRLKINALKRILDNRLTDQPKAIELLVLSACETATGDPRAPLGLAGVAIKAGARSTLATLWAVNDAATSELMSHFYQQLTNQSITKSEALRQAQLWLLHQPQYNHPVYWAPYLLVGNWL